MRVAQPNRAKPRSLAGATILQIVPALSDDPAGHAAVESNRRSVDSREAASVIHGPATEACESSKVGLP